VAPLTKLANRVAPEERDRGTVLVLTAFVMMLLLVIAAFATDLGAWYRQGQEQQRAADVGALNGVQAYDRGVKAYFAELEAATGRSVKTWGDLVTDDEFQAAEQRGLEEAANTIIGLLETSGLSFNDAGSGALASDPTDVNQQSIWTVVATDGTEVIITRSFVIIGEDAGGLPVYGRSIDVEVVAPGAQYFSNMIREAPQISRSASSVLSNCGAVCDTQVQLDPPFAGFNAAGSGDGYKPLLYDRDGDLTNGYEEVWAVNHHVNENSAGDIICMDVNTQTSCDTPWSIRNAGYNSANRPVELLSNTVDKIYAPITDRSDLNNLRSGLLCYDVALRKPCTTEFIDLWGSGGKGNGYTQVVGAFEYNNQLWVLGIHGRVACVTMSADPSGGMQRCAGTNEWSAPHAVHPDIVTEADDAKMGWGELVGDEIYILQRDKNKKAVLSCFDIGNKGACDGWGGAGYLVVNGYNGNEPMGFFRHDNTGKKTGLCVAVPQQSKHYCVNMNGGGGSASPMGGTFDSSVMAPMAIEVNKWIGSAHYWTNGETGANYEGRTFFSGGRSDMVGCWDWKANASCGPIDMDIFVPGNKSTHGAGADKVTSRADAEEIFPYHMSTMTPECIIGLGDQSIFYSFNPMSLLPCVDTQLFTTIEPCDCGDGVNKRWGVVQLPQDLLNDVTSLLATVTDPATGTVYLADEPLHLNGGILDLTGVPDTVPILQLNAKIDSKLGADDKPVWKDTKYFDLQIVVQPTLTN